MTSTSIPVSWTFLPLKELGDWSGGGTPSKAKPQYWQGGRIPWVSPKDMKTERISDSEDRITREAIAHSTASLIKAGSVLIVTRSGILRHTLPVAVSSVGVTVNQDLKALTPRNGIMAEYVAWALRAFGRDILNTCSKQGTTVNSVETAKLLRFEIPIAPPEQQRTIVAEIEKQFSRLDEAVANLKRVKVNLKRYKAAVLKAAVEGKLTEDWRKQHPNVEPASKLLERILAERRAKWNRAGNYKEPAVPDTAGLPLLPNNWKWASLDQLLLNITDGDHQPPPQTDSGVPFLVIGDVRSGRLDFEGTRFVSQQYADEVDVFRKPTRGDILYTLVGSFGIALRLDTDREFCIQRHIGILRPHKLSPASYLVHVLNSSFVFNQASNVATGTAQKTVPLSGLRRFAIPLAPLGEQQQIVVDVERRLSIIEELEAAVKANLTRAERLRQSVLQSAFSGRLLH